MDLFDTDKIRSRTHIVHGLENAPDAITLLFSGKNTGNLIVKVAEMTRLASRSMGEMK